MLAHRPDMPMSGTHDDSSGDRDCQLPLDRSKNSRDPGNDATPKVGLFEFNSDSPVESAERAASGHVMAIASFPAAKSAAIEYGVLSVADW